MAFGSGTAPLWAAERIHRLLSPTLHPACISCRTGLLLMAFARRHASVMCAAPRADSNSPPCGMPLCKEGEGGGVLGTAGV